MTCDICGCDTGGRFRHHSTPDCCLDAIRREKTACMERIDWLDARAGLIEGNDRVEGIKVTAKTETP